MTDQNGNGVAITIVGVDESGITAPRNDDTPGSALYDVPLKLNGAVHAEWADVFVRTWDRPPSWSTMHRPGIASVAGDRIWLRGTTLEEIEKHHLSTLKLCVSVANEKFNALLRSARAAKEAKRRREGEHRQHVRDAIKRLKFD